MEIMQTPRPKDLFRKACLEKLKKASQRNVYSKDIHICNVLYTMICEVQAKTVMLYLPLKTEVNLYPLIKRLRREKRKVYVPFMEGKSFSLVKYRYPLETKRFGIKEPKYSRQYRIKNIDIAIVPIVGVDAAGKRVGFGKGMYDRFFEKEIKNINKVVFVARELCYSKEKITDHYDIEANSVVTAQRFHF